MKVLFNIFSTISFIGVVSIIGGGAYVYVNRDALIDDVKQQVTEAALDGVMEAFPPGVGGIGGDAEVPAELPGVPTTLPAPGF